MLDDSRCENPGVEASKQFLRRIKWLTIHLRTAFCAYLFQNDYSFFSRFNDEVKHIKVIEKDSWIHITEAKKFESLLVSQIVLNTQNTHSASVTAQ